MLKRPWPAGLAAVAGLGLVLGGLAVPADVSPRLEARPSDVAATPAPAPRAPDDPITAIAMAPDGRLAWIDTGATGASLWLADVAGNARRLLRRTDATDLAWSPDGQWLFLVAPDKLLSLTTAGQPGSGIVTRLGGDTGRRFLGSDGWQAAALVASEEDGDGDGRMDRYALLRLRPGGQTDLLWAGRQRVSSAVTGPDGTVWLRLVGRNRVEIARLHTSGKLTPVYACRALETCSLATVDSAGRLYLVTSAAEDLDMLLRIDPDGQAVPLARDPLGQGDGEGVAVDARSRAPLALHLPHAGGRVVVAAAPARDLVAALSRRHPQASEVRIAGHAAGRWLVGIRDGQRAEVDWLLAEDQGARWRPALPKRQATRPATPLPQRRLEPYVASDGMRLFAYVTRPVGRGAGPWPLVVMVHGGPWSNSPPGYNASAARLAAQGMLVVEPQFRASRGHGRRYLLAAGNDFGDGRVLRDISDSADWLVGRGEADKDRVALMGASFGGYAALLATTLWPERFRGAVAAVPPPDMAWVAQFQAMAEQGDDAGLSLKASFASLGLDLDQRAAMDRLRAQSPLALAGRLQRPVLLLAGSRDDKVPIRSVNAYAASLCSLGKAVSYYVAPGQGHGLGRGPVAESARALTERFMAELLQGRLPPPAPVYMPPTPSPHGLLRKPCSRHEPG